MACDQSDGGEGTSSGTADSSCSRGSTRKIQPKRKKRKPSPNVASRFSTEQVRARWKSLNERRSKPGMEELNAARTGLPVLKHRY